MRYRLERVENRRRQADFYRARCWVYRHNPAAVIPLRRMEWSLLDSNEHPFYLHARRELWVAYDGRQPVGRIAAIVDDLHNSHYQDRLGFFGFFESPNDPHCASLLLNAAREWLCEQGCNSMRGPVSPSMKGEFGVLLTGHELPPYIMMGYSPPYYDSLLQSQGPRPVKKFFSFQINWPEHHAEILANQRHLTQVCERVHQRFPDISIRPATPANLDTVLREINRIGNTIRSRGWGFVPMTEAELDYMVKQIRRVIRPHTVIAAYWQDRLVGYNVTIPNVNWALRRARGHWDWLRLPQLLYWLPRIPQVRTIAVGVDPNIRAKGIATMLTKAMVDLGSQFVEWEFGWIDEANLPSLSALRRAVPMRQSKTYQLYEESWSGG